MDLRFGSRHLAAAVFLMVLGSSNFAQAQPGLRKSLSPPPPAPPSAIQPPSTNAADSDPSDSASAPTPKIPVARPLESLPKMPDNPQKKIEEAEKMMGICLMLSISALAVGLIALIVAAIALRKAMAAAKF